MRAGCALLGGETAEHPGLIAPADSDISATGVGVVEADDVLGPDQVRPGRCGDRDGRPRVCIPTATRWHATCCWRSTGWTWEGHVEEFGRTLGEELLEPTRIYAKDCLALAAETHVKDLLPCDRRRTWRATWRE